MVHIDNRKKDVLILGKRPTDGLDDTTLTAEKDYSINFIEQQKKSCLSLHYNILNSNIFVNGGEINKFKAKDSEINATPLCLCNVSVTVGNMKKTGLYGYVYDFSVDCDSIDVDNILDIYNYLMKKHDIKQCLD